VLRYAFSATQLQGGVGVLRQHRAGLSDRTDGGMPVTVIARYDAGRRLVRLITAWVEEA
jgi:hypothetical protein